MKLGLLGSEYVMINLPSDVEWKFEPVKTEIELENKNIKQYIEGFRFRGLLDFSESWIDATQYGQFKDIFNLGYASDTILSFYLNEILYPGMRLNVKWINEFNFKPIKGTEWGFFNGSIELLGANILTTVPALA